MKSVSILGALGFISLAVVFLVTALSMPGGLGGDIGPGFFPIVLCILMIITGVVIIVQELMKKSSEIVLNAAVVKALLIGVLAVVYVFVMELVGFVVVSPIFIYAVLHVLNQRKIWLNALFAIGITAGIYLTFGVALNVRLPASFLGF
jgi:putative tricarboxylic transport membrane protein